MYTNFKTDFGVIHTSTLSTPSLPQQVAFKVQINAAKNVKLQSVAQPGGQ
jgi:hypothetical protein